MNLSYKCDFMKAPDEKTALRLSCGRDFSLEDILYSHAELDSRDAMPRVGDIMPVLGGVYHIEVNDDLDKTYEEISGYAEGTYGVHRLQTFMKFISKYIITDYSDKFNFEFYKGKVLDLGKLLERDLINSMDAAVLLAFMINKDKELKEDGFTARCVAGHPINWLGKIKHSVLAVKVDSPTFMSYLAIPNLNKFKEISHSLLAASRNFNFVEVYETETHKLLMFGEYKPIFRKIV